MSAFPAPTVPARAAVDASPVTSRRRTGARRAGALAYPLMYFGVVAGVVPMLALLVITAPILFGVLFGAGETEFVAGFSRTFATVLLVLSTPFAVWVWGYVGVGIVAFVAGTALSLHLLRTHGVDRPRTVTVGGFFATLPIQLLFGIVSVIIVLGVVGASFGQDTMTTMRAVGQGIMIATAVNLLISAGLGALLFPVVLRAVKPKR